MRASFESMFMQQKIMIIEDEPAIASFIEEVAIQEGFLTQIVTHPESINLHDKQFEPDFIFLDLLMPDFDGLEVMSYLRQQYVKSYIVILSGSTNESRQIAERLGTAMGLNIIANLAKPIRINTLRSLLRKIKYDPDLLIQKAV